MKEAIFKDWFLIERKSGKKIYYYQEEDVTLDMNEVEKEVLERIEEIIPENRTGRSRWESRGIINHQYSYFNDDWKSKDINKGKKL